MDNIKGKFLVSIFVVLVLFTGFVDIVGSFNDITYTVTVSDKENINRGKSGYYLIYCKDDDGNYYEFTNKDSLLRGKFNSSRVYNEIEIGETYEFTVVGFRIPLFSWYQNIIGVEKVSSNQSK